MQYLSADWIMPVTSKPIANGVLLVNRQGLIQDVQLPDDISVEMCNVRHFNGILCPGFINTHNHLELSWAKDEIDAHAGLNHFIAQLHEKSAQTNNENIQDAIKQTILQMSNAGIVATADISNGLSTLDVKKKQYHYFHTFIELYGSYPQKAQEIFLRGLELEKEFPRASIAPHATYSVSDNLFELIANRSKQANYLLSLHHQETEDENSFYENGMGAMADSRKRNAPELPVFKGYGKRPIEVLWKYLQFAHKVLLVHNTATAQQDIDFIKQHLPQAYLCLCPNANLYIENHLPDIELFRKNKCNITLGTDSLASNSQISILEEIKTIHSKFPDIPLEELIKWGTYNGAEFLGIESAFGSFEKGKKCGIVHISNTEKLHLTKQSIARLIL